MTTSNASFPEAEVVPARPRGGRGSKATRMWWLTLLCLVTAVILVFLSLSPEGVRVTLHFDHGYGLEHGDPVRYRGIEVGVVDEIGIDAGHEGIKVEVRLLEHADRIARAGTRFWIERPRFDLGSIGGLDTLIGGRYIAVRTGPEPAPVQTRFEGSEAPPVGPTPEGGLDIVLEAPQRHGLTRGAPITYRGIPIGRVLDLGLAGDAAAVEARATIDPAYRNLVRTNTKFWNHGGLDVSVGLTGISLKVKDLSTLLQGSVALATPPNPGDQAPIGHHFTLHKEAEDDWLNWQPRIGIGAHLLPPGRMLPSPVRAALHWKDRTLGVRHERQIPGWLLPMEDGRFLGPTDLLSPPGDAPPGATLDVAGINLPLDSVASQLHEGWGWILPGDKVPPQEPAWPRSLFRKPEQPEDILLVGSPTSPPIAVSAARITAEGGRWRLDPALSLPADLHGATVLAIQDGAVVGLLLARKAPGEIVLLTRWPEAL